MCWSRTCCITRRRRCKKPAGEQCCHRRLQACQHAALACPALCCGQWCASAVDVPPALACNTGCVPHVHVLHQQAPLGCCCCAVHVHYACAAPSMRGPCLQASWPPPVPRSDQPIRMAPCTPPPAASCTGCNGPLLRVPHETARSPCRVLSPHTLPRPSTTSADTTSGFLTLRNRLVHLLSRHSLSLAQFGTARGPTAAVRETSLA